MFARVNRLGICDDHVRAECKDDGMLRSHGIELAARGQAPFGHAAIGERAAEAVEPRSFGCHRDAVAHLVDHVRYRRDVAIEIAHVDGHHHARTVIREMHVRIDEPRDERAPRQVDDLGIRTAERLDVARAADSGDESGRYTDGLDHRVAPVNGEDRTVDEHQIWDRVEILHVRLVTGIHGVRRHHSR